MNANDLRALLARWADEMAQKRDWLIELDSVVGDSDLGLTMSDGFRAASDAANACDLTDVGKLCYQAGKAMASAVRMAARFVAMEANSHLSEAVAANIDLTGPRRQAANEQR